MGDFRWVLAGDTVYISDILVLPIGVLMWEIFTGGDMPYGKMRNPEVVERVCHGKDHLHKPQSCPTDVYDLMKDCSRHVSNQ